MLLEKLKQQISFPVLINMNEGLVEYILVTGKGKTHESLLVTRTEPFHIHVAMLLLGAIVVASITNMPSLRPASRPSSPSSTSLT